MGTLERFYRGHIQGRPISCLAASHLRVLRPRYINRHNFFKNANTINNISGLLGRESRRHAGRTTGGGARGRGRSWSSRREAPERAKERVEEDAVDEEDYGRRSSRRWLNRPLPLDRHIAIHTKYKILSFVRICTILVFVRRGSFAKLQQLLRRGREVRRLVAAVVPSVGDVHNVRRAARRVDVHRHDRVDQGAWHDARAQQSSLAPGAGGHTLLPVCAGGHGPMGRVLMRSDQRAI